MLLLCIFNLFIYAGKITVTEVQIFFGTVLYKAVKYWQLSFYISLTLSQTSPGFNVSAVQVFKKH